MFNITFSSTEWDILINSIGLLGIILLAIPAWYANKYGKLLARLTLIDPHSPALKKRRDDTIQDIKKLQESWTPWKSNLLIGGTILAGLSYIFGLIKALVVG